MKLWGNILALLVCFSIVAAEPALDPMPVCEALASWNSLREKPLAVLGRYSYRRTGTWLDQEACDGKDRRGVFRLQVDRENAPRPPDTLVLDERSLESKVTALKQRTALGKFRFGSPEYDRWAVVYGSIEPATPADGMKLLYRGDGAVFFFVDK